MSYPTLDRLAEERVFSITKLPDGTFEVIEGCDTYFSVILTADEIEALGRELLHMVDV